MNPKKWGKSFWILILNVVINTNDMEYINKFLDYISNILPCVELCRPNYRKHLKKKPHGRNVTKDDLLLWLYNIYKFTVISQHRKEVPTYEMFIGRINISKDLIRYYTKKALKYACKEMTSRDSIIKVYVILEKLNIIKIIWKYKYSNIKKMAKVL